jgi:hypothetical protein
MHIIEFFNSDEIKLPQERDGEDFGTFIVKLFDGYLEAVNKLNGDDYISRNISSNKNLIRVTCDSINKAISEYRCGSTDNAYSEIEKTIKNNSVYFSNLASRFDLSNQDRHFYRMQEDNDHDYSRERMFHPPFNNPELWRKDRRYSIPEYPCLYLGASVKVCWEEIKRDDIDINKIKISRLELKPNSKVKILDIGYRPAYVATYLNKCSNTNEIISYNFGDFFIANAVCWPLIAACSIKVKDEDAPTAKEVAPSKKDEYIVPGLVLEYVYRNVEGYHAIRYFSTKKEEEYPESPRLFQNFVFPAREKVSQGHCPYLKSIFMITDPITNQSSELIDNVALKQLPDEEIDYNNSKQKYKDTDLGRMEAKLINKKLFNL